MLATGGGDMVINPWHDSTALDKEEAFRKEVYLKSYSSNSNCLEEGILRGQELKNALIYADYTRAIQIALERRRPHDLLDIFGEINRERDAGDQLGKALEALSKEKVYLLWEYVKEWNTKTKIISYCTACFLGIFHKPLLFSGY
ncbi:PREDICTED: uncharacterized protein LOC109224106 [Nicotiana attenuata]|uniref:U3 small nucleolar RNA-associated protein 13 C-terminal domain-containing protein n=1 Tax=Nicotiana attenuata TaxID=49451 RepID=A0A1J6IKK8_NICAT|nr:PREDICTED: uncharacterized protein LOC109224106 [Nicotiana attenuata]OIT05374.1 hypothetical protein A4A49_17542 [Nicotiana attenuata]